MQLLKERIATSTPESEADVLVARRQLWWSDGQTLAVSGAWSTFVGTCSWRTKGEYDTLLRVVLRTCTVAIKDIQEVEHSINVTAETLYEAIATALAALKRDNWVGEIGQGNSTVTVVVQQPPVKHEVKMKDFVSWLGRQGRSPAEVVLKQKLERILGRAKEAKT